MQPGEQSGGYIIPRRDDLLNVHKAGERMGVSEETVRNMIRDGRLKAKRLGKRWITTIAWVDEFLGAPDNCPR